MSLVLALLVCALRPSVAQEPVVRHLALIPELNDPTAASSTRDTAVYVDPLETGSADNGTSSLDGGNLDAEGEAYSLEWLEATAVRSNPALGEALARIDMAWGRYQQVGLPPNPTIGYVGGEIGNEGFAGQQGAFVSQTFVRGGKLGLSQTVACHEVHRRQHEYAVIRQQILTDVRTSFYTIIWLQRRIELLERFLETNRAAATVAQRLFVAGDNTRADSLLAEIEFEQTSTELVAVEASHDAAWRELARILATEDLAPVALQDDVTAMLELTWAATLARMADHPSLQVLMAELARERASVQRARAEPIPNINAQVALQYDASTDYTIAGIQVGAPIPVLNHNQGAIYEATASVRATQRKLDRTRLSIEKNLASKFAEYERAKRRLGRITQRIVPKAEEVVRITLSAYEAGDVGMADVLNAQRSLLRASLGKQDAEQQLRVSYVAIEGFLLADGMGG